jgi:hypothetical protein
MKYNTLVALQETDAFTHAYAHGLYPLPPLMLYTSTFLTSLLAWHRFRHVQH